MSKSKPKPTPRPRKPLTEGENYVYDPADEVDAEPETATDQPLPTLDDTVLVYDAAVTIYAALLAHNYDEATTRQKAIEAARLLWEELSRG